ncbi:MAG: hypothetical protein QM490_05545 [Candidatus Gracilibacteria bacterium]
MIRKLLLSILIFFTVYILLIFKAPIVAGAIEKVLGIKGFNEFILGFKSTFDDTVTDIPTKAELRNAYDAIHSGALNFKENFDIGVDYTKKQIDEIRETLSGAEDTFNNVKDGYENIKEYIDTNSGVIQDVRDTIEAFSGITEKLTNSGTTDGIQNTIDTFSEIRDNLIGTGIIDETTNTGATD